MKSAEGAFDAASDRFGVAERALDAAREERAQARRDRLCGPAGVWAGRCDCGPSRAAGCASCPSGWPG